MKNAQLEASRDCPALNLMNKNRTMNQPHLNTAVWHLLSIAHFIQKSRLAIVGLPLVGQFVAPALVVPSTVQ